MIVMMIVVNYWKVKEFNVILQGKRKRENLIKKVSKNFTKLNIKKEQKLNSDSNKSSNININTLDGSIKNNNKKANTSEIISINNDKIKALHNELEKVKKNCKKYESKIDTLEKNNKSLENENNKLIKNYNNINKTIDVLKNWKTENETFIKEINNKDDLNEKLPYVLLDLMKNVNNLNTFNHEVLNGVLGREVSGKRKRRVSFSNTIEINGKNEDEPNECENEEFEEEY